MGRPSNAAKAAAAAAQADDTKIEGADADRELEPFERPVVKVTADEAAPAGKVKVRVTHKGDGRISTGHYDQQINAFTYHKKGDFLFLHESIANAQQDNGLVEIVDGD